MKNNSNFLHIQTPQECLERITQLPHDEKTRQKEMVGLCAYFQLNMAQFTSSEVEQFFNAFPASNIKMAGAGFECFVRQELENQRVPNFIVDTRTFSSDFQVKYLFDFLDLIAKKGTPRQKNQYLAQHKQALYDALITKAYDARHELLQEVLFIFPQKIAKNQILSEEQKLDMYRTYFSFPTNVERDKSVLPSLFRFYSTTEVLLSSTLEPEVWRLVAERLAEHQISEHKEVREKFQEISLKIFSSNLSFLFLCEEHQPQMLENFFQTSHTEHFSYNHSETDYSKQKSYTLSSLQHLFVEASKNAWEPSTEALLKHFFSQYHTRILGPVVQTELFKEKNIDFIEYVFNERLNNTLPALSFDILNTEEAESIVALAFSMFFDREDTDNLDTRTSQKILQESPTELFLKYHTAWKNSKGLHRVAGNKKALLHILFEQKVLEHSIHTAPSGSEQNTNSVRTTFKV